MKTILPCPGCQQFFLPPPSVADHNTLRCPGCGMELAASSIVKEISPASATWIVDGGATVTAASPEANTDGVLLEDTFSAIDEDHGFDTLAPSSEFEKADLDAGYPFSKETETQHSELGISETEDFAPERSEGTLDESISGALPLVSSSVIPPSNEWETQPSNLDNSSFESLNDSDVTEDHLQSEPFQFEEPTEVDSVEPSDSPFAATSVEPSDETSGDLHALEHESDALTIDSFDGDDFSEVVIEEEELLFEEENEAQQKEEIVEQKVEQSEEKPLTLAPVQNSRFQKLDPLQSVGRPRKKKQESSVKMFASVIGGGFAAIPIAMLLMWYMLGTDPFKIGPTVAQYVPWIVPKQFAEAAGGRFRNLGSNPSGPQGTRNLPTVQGAVEKDSQPNPPSNLLPTFSNAPNTPAPVEPAPIQQEAPLDKSLDIKVDTSENKEMTKAAAPVVDTPRNEPSIALPDASTSAQPAETAKPVMPETENVKAPVNPSESIEALRTAIDADPTSSEYFQSIYDAMERIGNDLIALHKDNSPSLSTWQQSATKVMSSITKNPEVLKSLMKLRLASIDASGAAPSATSGLAISSGFNAIRIGDIQETETGEEWISSAASQGFWKGTRILVPSSLRIKGKQDTQYLIIGAAQPATDVQSNNQSGHTTDFTVLIAIPR